MKNNTYFTSVVEYDSVSDEYFVKIPDELLQQLDWKVGDSLTYKLEPEKVVLFNSTKETRDRLAEKK
jgi:bifunctional DNA-binding transcriptional regulator/antitoxin component of YhaV-PrlF toxin-antitoxin module